MARSSGGAAFGSLFMHIKKNDIGMTAPVEMAMGDGAGGSLRREGMAFLYESPGQGSTGKDGRVIVEDKAAVTVLSIGLRGPIDGAKMEAARKAVLSHLAASPGWMRAGDFRLMGYNCPFVPATQRFYE